VSPVYLAPNSLGRTVFVMFAAGGHFGSPVAIFPPASVGP
jgi:hypothetical protein